MVILSYLMNNFSPGAVRQSALQTTVAKGAATLPNTSTTLPTGFIFRSMTSVYILGSCAGSQRRTRSRFPTVCATVPITFT